VASDELRPSPLISDSASLTNHALARNTKTLLGSGVRERAAELTNPGSDGDGLIGWLALGVLTRTVYAGGCRSVYWLTYKYGI
jgi:hypothetical protein